MLKSAPPTRVVYTSDLKRARRPLRSGSVRKSIEALTNGPLEAWSGAEKTAVACTFHPFMAGVHAAFSDHRPLVLSPDMLWLLIAQGFARIVNEDPEGLRRRFVEHEGKLQIEIRRDDFVPGSKRNDWPGVFTQFSESIRVHVGLENHEALVTSFSTTGPVEKAANEIAFLDAMQNYFELKMTTLCGIPEVVLEGTPADWQHLAERAKNIRDLFDCGWWLDHVTPWLDRIAASASGAEDPELWESIYKLKDMSGGSRAGGWIVQLFPFLQKPHSPAADLHRNPFLGMTLEEVGFVEVVRNGHRISDVLGVTTLEWPAALSAAPFLWAYREQPIKMRFLAGFTHCTQDERTLAVRPAIGWAVQAV